MYESLGHPTIISMCPTEPDSIPIPVYLHSHGKINIDVGMEGSSTGDPLQAS